MFQNLGGLQVGKDGLEGGLQMPRVNPVETFPEAGIGRSFRNTEEGPQVEGHRQIVSFTAGLAIKSQERGQLEKEQRQFPTTGSPGGENPDG